jgi:hypothetical protein
MPSHEQLETTPPRRPDERRKLLRPEHVEQAEPLGLS